MKGNPGNEPRQRTSKRRVARRNNIRSAMDDANERLLGEADDGAPIQERRQPAAPSTASTSSAMPDVDGLSQSMMANKHARHSTICCTFLCAGLFIWLATWTLLNAQKISFGLHDVKADNDTCLAVELFVRASVLLYAIWAIGCALSALHRMCTACCCWETMLDGADGGKGGGKAGGGDEAAVFDDDDDAGAEENGVNAHVKRKHRPWRDPNAPADDTWSPICSRVGFGTMTMLIVVPAHLAICVFWIVLTANPAAQPSKGSGAGTVLSTCGEHYGQFASWYWVGGAVFVGVGACGLCGLLCGAAKACGERRAALSERAREAEEERREAEVRDGPRGASNID